MDKEIFSKIAKLFIVGFCALFLGVAGRYYSVRGFDLEDTSLKQVASMGIQASDLEKQPAEKTIQEENSTPEMSGKTLSESAIINPNQINPAPPQPTTQPNVASEGSVNTAPTAQPVNPNPTAAEETGLPNLTVTNLIISPLPMDKNGSIRITATIRNTGTARAVNVSGALENMTNNYSLGAHTGYTFAPGQQYDFWEQDSYPYFATCENGGVNKIRFTIDPLNKIQESNESDNSFDIPAALVGC